MADGVDIREGDLADLLDAVARVAPVPMLIASGNGRVLAANRPWRDLSGTGGEAGASTGWADGLDEETHHRLARAMDHCAASGAPTTLELEICGPSGRRWTRWWMHRRLIESTPVLVLVAIDVHDDVVQRDDLRQLATRDDLTGLVNRRVFLETVDQALRRVERFGEPASVLYIDLDSFKMVNDRAGHAVGDRVLAAVAGRLRKAVRGADVVGRIGGDEFAVLLERLATRGETAIVARRIQEALSGSVEVAGEHWPISASVGIAITEGGGETALGLLARADEAMYLAKRGRTKPLADDPRTDAPTDGIAVSPDGPRPPAASPTIGASPDGARSPVAAPPRRTLTITAADVRLLRDGMDTIRRSLETLLEGLAGPQRH